MVNTRKWFLIKLLIFYCLLACAKASCTLGPNPYIDMVVALICFNYFRKNALFETTNTKILAAVIIIIGNLWTKHGTSSILAYPGELMNVLLPCLLICLRLDVQIDIFRSLTKYLSITLLLSAGYWFLHLSGISLPHFTTISYTESFEQGWVVNNYILFQESFSYIQEGLVPEYLRFRGVFLEPGHAGSIAAIFLFANRFEIKNISNCILLFIVVITFSTAAYVILVLGLILYFLSKRQYNRIFITLVFFGVLIAYFSQYNEGSNIVNEFLLDKLTNEDRGLERRFTEEANRLYDNLWNTFDIFWGYGATVSVPHAAGYKIFIINNGLLGVFFVIWGYFLIYRTRRSQYAFFLFIVVISSFLQRTYCYWDAFLDPYILGVSYVSLNSNLKQML